MSYHSNLDITRKTEQHNAHVVTYKQERVDRAYRVKNGIYCLRADMYKQGEKDAHNAMWKAACHRKMRAVAELFNEQLRAA